MPRQNNNMIVVYSKVPADRSYIRGCLSGLDQTIVCFEKESVCFDNLESIQPAVVIVKDDSDELVWRFLSALNAFGVHSAMLIVSDVIAKKKSIFENHKLPVHCFADRLLDSGFKDFIGRMVNDALHNTEARYPLFLGESDPIQTIHRMLPSLAKSNDPILISGEKGVGKAFLARCAVDLSTAKGQLILLDCGSLGEKMAIRTAMKKNALQAGEKQRVTVLLKNVHLLKKAAQAEILLLLDQPEKWLGESNGGENGSIRFIATSDLDLDAQVDKGRFRKDLFFRLNVIPVSLPPLRKRPMDIPMLADHFLIHACVKWEKSVLLLSQQAKEILVHYDWPGNIDELENMMESVAFYGDESQIYENNGLQRAKANTRHHFFSTIDENALPGTFEIQKYLPTLTNISLKRISDQFVSRTEKILMEKALESTSWNRKKAAELLNISYKSMLNKMKLYEIS